MWGVAMKFGSCRRGFPALTGSSSKTSAAAAASCPLARAAASAASSTIPPRAALTRRLPGFIWASWRGPIRPRVFSVSGAWTVMKSARPRSSSRPTSSTLNCSAHDAQPPSRLQDLFANLGCAPHDQGVKGGNGLDQLGLGEPGPDFDLAGLAEPPEAVVGQAVGHQDGRHQRLNGTWGETEKGSAPRFRGAAGHLAPWRPIRVSAHGYSRLHDARSRIY